MVSILPNNLRNVSMLPNWASPPWQPTLGAWAGCSESLAGWTCANLVPRVRIRAIHMQTWHHLPGFLFLCLVRVRVLFLALALVLLLFLFLFPFLFLCLCLSFSSPLALPIYICSVFLCSPFMTCVSFRYCLSFP